MQFKENIWFRVDVGFKQAIHTGLAAQSGFIYAILKAFHTPNDSLIYLNKSILPPFQLSFVAARILSFLC